MIEFDSLVVAHGEREVLRGISCQLDEHRIGIVGANGSGKSTLARTINGLVLPDAGRVMVDGLDTVRDGAQVRRRVGFVFTDADNQIVMPTVAEDIAFSLRRSGLPKAEQQQLVDQALARFGLTGHADHPTHLLSGGQKQLLALAAITITSPPILVADEPTTLLDLRNSRIVADHLNAVAHQLVLVTHHLELLDGFERVLVVDDGRIVADDAPAPALARYRRLVER